MTAKAPREITTNQEGPHEDLLDYVRRYQSGGYKKPIAEHTQSAFYQANEVVAQWQGDVILDSCCGVGESSLEIAALFPEALVIGVDKSEHRLARLDSYRESKGINPDYILMLRADLNDFWRLAVEAGWSLKKHYLLYPNPYPKKKHLQRRWHAGPSFPYLLQLGGELEVRSNWKIYIEEFSESLSAYEFASEVREYVPEHGYWTPFERKYHSSGQSLWHLKTNLNSK